LNFEKLNLVSSVVVVKNGVGWKVNKGGKSRGRGSRCLCMWAGKSSDLAAVFDAKPDLIEENQNSKLARNI
jgi:hypothetical protein